MFKSKALWVLLPAVLLLGVPVILRGQDIRLPRNPDIRVFSPDRTFLGVQVRDVTSNDVKDLKLPAEAGAYVEDVHQDSPASKAGLKTGDVIVALDGFRVVSVRQLQRLVEDVPAGRTVGIKIVRNGQTLEEQITPEEEQGWPRRYETPDTQNRFWDRDQRDFSLRLNPDHFGRDFFFFSGRPRLGITGSDLTDQMAEFLGVPGKQGVLVMEVRADSPASRAGLKAGDVITAVDGDSIQSLQELTRQLSDGHHELEIVRNKQAQKLSVRIGNGDDERVNHL